MQASLEVVENQWEKIDDTSRIVTLGGTITEIVYALGAGDQVVGVDASSSYPPEVNDLEKVAYHRRLSAEGILSLAPTLVIATSETGPPEAIQQLRDAGLFVLIVPHEPTIESAVHRIEHIASALDALADGDELIEQLKRDLHVSPTTVPTKRTKVLFLYARGQGTLMVAGRETGADTIIGLAGGANAVRGYTGFKTLTPEAAIAAAPEVILLMDSGLESIGGEEGLWQVPGLELTPAGRHHRVVSMDGLLLLGFGPRTGKAVLELNQALYPVERAQQDR